MPVRFDSEKINEQPDIALALVIDRSGSMQGPKLEAAKESARVTAEVLSPNDYIAVVAFDSEAQVLVRPQRAGNRMRISHGDLAGCNSGGGTNIYPGLKEAFEILQGINAKVKHVILMTDGEAPTDGHRRARPGDARVADHGVVRRRPGRRPQPARDDRRRRRRPALHGRGHRRAAADLHEGDPGGAEEPARRGRRPRPRREEGRGDRGHRRRERAAAPRLRHDQAQADRGDDPDLGPRRADPRALALRRRHLGRVDLRRQEPLGASTGSAGAATRSSGRRSCAARCAARSTTATTCTRRSPTAARRSRSTRSTPATSSSTSSTPRSR